MTLHKPVPLTQSLAAFIAAHRDLRGELARHLALAGPSAETAGERDSDRDSTPAPTPARAMRRRLEIVVSKIGTDTTLEVR